MPHINYLLWNRIPHHLKEVMEYYPDVSLFDFNQIQYTYFWHQLSSAKYIYTNGYELKPTSWFRYAFESFKGWLGFENHCQPEKITYNLNKLAYYGYTKHFNQPNFAKMTTYPLSLEISALATKKYQQLTTAALQQELIKAYFQIEPHLGFEYAYQRLNPSHRFGDSWLNIDAPEFIPVMDPQDTSLIFETVKVIDKKASQTLELIYLKGSKYAQVAAQYYYDKAKKIVPPSSFFGGLLWHDPRPSYLQQALAYNIEITQTDPCFFIDHYIGKKEYSNAVRLLERLDAPKVVLKYLLLIPELVRNPLIEKDSSLAAVLATHYLERKQYPLAQQLYSNIETLNPTVAFTLAIKDKKHVKAYEIFKKFEHSNTFSSSERKSLATVFLNEAEKEYEKGSTYREKRMWPEAEQHYLRSLVQKKAAQHLNPSPENLEQVFTHQRLYAQILVNADLDLNKAEASNLANIQKAINLLKECRSTNTTEQDYHKEALAMALMRRADTLREKISFNYTPAEHSSIKEHKKAHEQELSAFIKTLEELIDLLKGTRDETLRLKLGKAYFLLADVQDFFDINDPNINQNYKKAMEAVPENPFYILRVTEVFPEEKDNLQSLGVAKLKGLGFNVFDYIHWFDERWVKRDDVIHTIKDIHTLDQAPINTSALSFVA